MTTASLRPADILLPNRFLGKIAAFDVSIASLLSPLTLLEAGVLATQVTEARKHLSTTPNVLNLGVCVPPWWLNPMEPGVKSPLHNLFYHLKTHHLHGQAKVGGAQWFL